MFQPHVSPDGAWLIFNAYEAGDQTSAINITSSHGADWSHITDGKYWDDKPGWSADGKTIYFGSNRGGFFNVWGITFDSSSGKPVGKPFRVTNFDSPAQMVSPIMVRMEVSLAPDRMVFPITETSGNIWLLDNLDR